MLCELGVEVDQTIRDFSSTQLISDEVSKEKILGLIDSSIFKSVLSEVDNEEELVAKAVNYYIDHYPACSYKTKSSKASKKKKRSSKRS